MVSSYSLAEPVSVLEQNDATSVTDDEAYAVPTSIRDTLMTNDSIIVVHTICAPICSSHARVYNKEWQEIGVLKAPFKSAFPEAYIEDGKILWRDNDNFDYTPQL
jgi:hypothetical protein